MQVEGIQTQQRYIRIKNVCSIHYSDATLTTAAQPINRVLSLDSDKKDDIIRNSGKDSIGVASDQEIIDINNISRFSHDNNCSDNEEDGENDSPILSEPYSTESGRRKLMVSAFDNPVDYRLVANYSC
jgi:hypothetical protein